MPHIAVYGTLRKGHYNHDRFPMQWQSGIKNPVRIQGYKLYDLGPYPCVVYTGNPKDETTFEIYHVTQQTKNVIDAMEFGAGYDEKKQPITNEVMASIYVFDQAPLRATEIVSGDYTEYIKLKSDVYKN